MTCELSLIVSAMSKPKRPRALTDDAMTLGKIKQCLRCMENKQLLHASVLLEPTSPRTLAGAIVKKIDEERVQSSNEN